MCAGVAALGASLLAGAAHSVPPVSAAGTWSGPHQLPRTAGFEATLKILPVGERLHLVQPALNAQGSNYSRLTATPLVQGRPGELASTRDMEGLWAERRHLGLAASPRGVTAAIRYREGYATIDFDGVRWGLPFTQVPADDYLIFEGHSVTEDRAGNATYAWVQTTIDRRDTSFRTHSFYVRQRIADQWREPKLLYQMQEQGDSSAQEVPEPTGPAVTSLATGELLACSDWRVNLEGTSNRLRCWSSPGPGNDWTPLPRVEYPYGSGSYSEGKYSVSLLSDATPMIVILFNLEPGLVYTQFASGSWSRLAPLAPRPSTPIPEPSLRFLSFSSVVTDGQGGLLVTSLLFERGWTTAGYEDEQMTVISTAHRGKGWESWRKLSPTYSGPFAAIGTGLGTALSTSAGVVSWVKRVEFNDPPAGLYVNEFAAGGWSGPRRVSDIKPSQMGSQVFAGMTASNDAALAWDGAADGNPFNSSFRVFGSRIAPVDKTLGPPRALVAKASPGKVRLSWKPPATGANRVTSYEWTVSIKGTDRWSKWKTVRKGAKARSVVAKGIKRGVNYVFEVRATAGKQAGPGARVEARGQ